MVGDVAWGERGVVAAAPARGRGRPLPALGGRARAAPGELASAACAEAAGETALLYSELRKGFTTLFAND